MKEDELGETQKMRGGNQKFKLKNQLKPLNKKNVLDNWLSLKVDMWNIILKATFNIGPRQFEGGVWTNIVGFL